jgi:hypothetical protein
VAEQTDVATQHPAVAKAIADYLTRARSDSPDWKPVWKKEK